MSRAFGPVPWPDTVFILGEVSSGIYLYHQRLMTKEAQTGGLKFAGLQILPPDFFLILVLASIGF